MRFISSKDAPLANVGMYKLSAVIKYKKGTINKVANMLSRPPIVASIVLKNASLSHESYIEQYADDDDFNDIYEKQPMAHRWNTTICRERCSIIWASYVFLSVKESM